MTKFTAHILIILFGFSGVSAYGQDMAERVFYESFDGQTVSYLEMGEGPTVILLHGFMSSAQQNYVDTGIAQKIAAAGYHIVAPDMRGHGQSRVKDAPKSWPRDAAARDQIALIAHLGEEPHAVVGYSFGAIAAVRLHLLSRKGGRLVLGGVGDSIADEWNTDRNDGFRAAIAMVKAGIDNPVTQRITGQARATGGTLAGYEGALSSRTYTPADLLGQFNIPVLVMTGDADFDNGSGEALATIMPNAKYKELTGTHISAVIDPDLPQNIIEFLESEPER